MSTLDPFGADEMPCSELVELVTDYLEGALSPEVAARFEAHLEICPPCVVVIDQWREVIALAGALREADVDTIDAGVRTQLAEAFRAAHPGG